MRRREKEEMNINAAPQNSGSYIAASVSWNLKKSDWNVI